MVLKNSQKKKQKTLLIVVKIEIFKVVNEEINDTVINKTVSIKKEIYAVSMEVIFNLIVNNIIDDIMKLYVK